MADTLYRILIVDDEEIIRNGLKKIVNWEELGFQIAATAPNGFKALEVIEKEKIDVVILDIKMPQFNGLELSKYLFENFPDIRIIILSGYADFKYAQETIDYNVYSYLLKPSRKKVITELFSKLHEDMDKDSDSKKILRKGHYYQKAEIANAIAHRKDTSFDLSLFPQEAQSFTLMLCRYVFDFSSPESIANHAKQNRSIYADLNQSILDSYGHEGMFFPFIDEENYLCILIKCDSHKVFDYGRDVFSHLMRANIQDIGLALYGGLGRLVPRLQEISESYDSARYLLDSKALFEKNTIITTDFLDNIKTVPIGHSFDNTASKMILAIRDKDHNTLEELLSEIITEMKNHRIIEQEILTAYTINLLISLREISLERNWKLIFPTVFSSLLANASHIETYENMNNFLYHILSQTQFRVNVDAFEPENNLIKMAFHIINSDLGKQHSLVSIAEELNISPSYFSHLFKKEMGLNFKDYLMKRRIKKATVLLKESNYKIYEIADVLGFNDPHYFSEVFRKHTSFYPSEYRTGEITA